MDINELQMELITLYDYEATLDIDDVDEALQVNREINDLQAKIEVLSSSCHAARPAKNKT